MESNLEAVQRAFREFSKHNVPAIIKMCTDDVTWESYVNPAVPFAGTFEGKEGVKRYFDRLAEEIEYTAVTAREFCDQGNLVIALGRHIGRVKRTGKSFDHDWAMVFKLRDSKIYSYFCYVDTRELSEAFQGSIVGQRREVLPTSAATAGKR